MTRRLALCAFLGALAATPSAATVLYSDNFERPDGPTVGEGWGEWETGARYDGVRRGVYLEGGDVRLHGAAADARVDGFFGTLPERALISRVIGTTGFQDVTVNFTWQSLFFNTVNGASLHLSWAPAPAPEPLALTEWREVGVFRSGSTTNFSESIALGPEADDGLIQVMFWINVASFQHGFEVKEMSISATPIPQPPPPLPAVPAPPALAGLGAALLALGALGRRRRRAPGSPAADRPPTAGR